MNLAIIRGALLIVFSTLALAQKPAEPRKLEFDPEKPNQILGYIDGKPFTSGEFQSYLVSVDSKIRDATRDNPIEVLRHIGFLRHLAALALEKKLDQKDPYREQLELRRLEILGYAMLQQFDLENVATAAEQQNYYNDHKDAFSSAKLKLIYIPYTNATEELQAKKKAEEVAAKIKAGADFVAMVKLYSKNETSAEKGGDYGPVKRTDTDLPEPARAAIFGLKPGEVSAPTKLANGYYLFKLIAFNVQPYAEVKDDIFKQLQQDHTRDLLAKVRTSVDVKLAEPPK